MTKSIATGLLTFAALASIAQAQDEVKTSYEGGKGFSIKAGDKFGVNISGFLQANFSTTQNDDDSGATNTSTFNVPRSRLTLKGNAFSKDLLFTLQLDGSDAGSAGDGAIKEGHATWNFVAHDDYTVGLRLGQGKTNYGFEGTGSSSGTFFSDTSMVTKAFANGYSRGAWLIGNGMQNRLRWTAGAMNSDTAAGISSSFLDRGEESANSNDALSYTGTVNFDPVGKIVDGNNESFRQGAWEPSKTKADGKEVPHDVSGTVGLGIARGDYAANTGTSSAPVHGPDVESTSININTVWNINSLQILGEYYMRTDDRQDVTAGKEESSGFHVMGTYLFPKSGDSAMRWGVGLRYAAGMTDDGDDGTVNYLTGMRGIGSAVGDCTEITAAVGAFYNKHGAKTVLEITKQDVEPDAGGDTTNYIATVAFQVMF